MQPDRSPKVNDLVLAEAPRRGILLAVPTEREINENWAVIHMQVSHLHMWARQERGRKKP